ncbi:hypothetical protein [Streptomyces sp. NPDC102437]|uniref:hypothetical protein n=1 Tax=Streptomyces sp. NPDC102437 TaxID=3366175 RepID=UPI00380C80B2
MNQKPAPVDRAGPTVLLRTFLGHVRGPGRVRVLACLELHREATRTSWPAAPIDAFAAADFAYSEHAQRSAGLPSVTVRRAATVTLALHAALPHLVADNPTTQAAAGLDGYVNGLLDTVYGTA